MWGYSERDVEEFLVRREIIFLGGGAGKRYKVITNQFTVTFPESTQVGPGQFQIPLWTVLEGLPTVAGQARIPDVISYRIPKTAPGRRTELRVIEIKNRKAVPADVAQLNQYIHLLEFLIRNNINRVNLKLKIPKTSIVKGFLLARSIPLDVWLAANSLYEASPKVELLGYEITSHKKRKRIHEIRFFNFTSFYRRGVRKNLRDYKANLKISFPEKE